MISKSLNQQDNDKLIKKIYFKVQVEKLAVFPVNFNLQFHY